MRNRYKIPLCVLFFAGIGTDPLPANPDPLSLLRAGRFQEIQDYFKSRRPVVSAQKYALARAHFDGDAKPSHNDLLHALNLFLSVAGIDCKAVEESSLLRCLGQIADENRSDIYARLALQQGAAVAEKLKWDRTELRLLELISLQPKDPLSRAVYAERLHLMINHHLLEKGEKLAATHLHLDSPVINTRRGAVFQKNGNRDQALRYIFRAASQTDTGWLLKSIYKSLNQQYPELLSGEAPVSAYHRQLVHFSEEMSHEQFAALKNSLSAAALLASTTVQSVLHDGLFLIRADEEEVLSKLAEIHYTHLSLHPEILQRWVSLLMKEKKYPRALALFEQFNHARKNSPALWRSRIALFKELNRTDAFFSEMLEYLAEYHYDYRISDELISFLIKADDRKILLADERYWEQARRTLPFQTGSGRFLYWLHRYYIEKNNQFAIRDIESRFYEMAPGSYYARSFWDQTKSGDYVADWNYVVDRGSYLRWVGKHGRNRHALKFLSRQNLTPYYDPAALRLAAEIQNLHFPIPYEIMELYRSGETMLANEFYEDRYDGNVSEMQDLMQRIYIGRNTGNLFLSVYYIRSLLRKLNIPEDPFSLPPFLLKELYPRPYYETVKKYAHHYGINEYMIYGVMRQESMYRETAVSRSGAKGLMQIMPSTGRWLARLMKLGKPDLHDPAISIQMGTKFFGDLHKKYGNDFRWAAIAYNGGPGNLAKWKRKYYTGDFNLFLEKLPVEESRNYCRFTYQNFSHYQITYTLYP